jgi:hypothetical protein
MPLLVKKSVLLPPEELVFLEEDKRRVEMP